MHELVAKIDTTIKRYGLIQPGDKLLLGISGGVDSVGLLLALLQLEDRYNFELTLVHVNHRVRGQAADTDEKFVRTLAKERGLNLVTRRLTLKRLQALRGGSLENKLRQLRYQLFLQVAKREAATALALGHHRDDLVETLLQRLLRGTGPEGLRGFLPAAEFQGLRIIRPLFEIPREEIAAFVKGQGASWQEDASNQDLRFLRNRIRHQLLPLLESEYNPQIRTVLFQLALIMAEEDEWLEEQSREQLGQLVTQEQSEITSCSVEKFTELPMAMQRRVLRNWLMRYSPTPPEFKYVSLIERLLREGKVGTHLKLFGSLKVYRDYERLYLFSGRGLEPLRRLFLEQAKERFLILSPQEQVVLTRNEIPVRAGELKSVEVSSGQSLVIRAFPAKEALKLRRGQAFSLKQVSLPLTVRTRRPGDCFHPQGAPGAMKLKKFFIDQKLPKLLRSQIGLLCQGSEVLAIPGMRLSQKLVPTTATPLLYELRIM